MIGQNTWSYPAYTPLLWERGELYISRLAPGKDCIHLEWMPCGETAVYIGKAGENHFSLAGSTTGCEYDIVGLETDTDYAIYVACGEKKSLVRLARTGETVGTVVNYLHPDDRYYAFSGNYLCSPSLLRLPDGGLLASMDLFGSGTPQNLTLIFRSDDDGQTWHHLSELMPCFWGKLFLHKGDVYMLGCSTEYGDLLIGRSTDGGKTFGAPVTLLRGSNGKSGHCGVHKNPQPVFRHKGRIYESLEWVPGQIRNSATPQWSCPATKTPTCCSRKAGISPRPGNLTTLSPNWRPCPKQPRPSKALWCCPRRGSC